MTLPHRVADAGVRRAIVESIDEQRRKLRSTVKSHYLNGHVVQLFLTATPAVAHPSRCNFH
jgi:hypothetical protein